MAKDPATINPQSAMVNGFISTGLMESVCLPTRHFLVCEMLVTY